MASSKTKRPAARSWLRPFVIFSLILLLPPALYFFVYVEQRVDTASRHAYGVLAAVTSDLKSRLEAHDKIAKNADGAPNARQFLDSLPDVQITMVADGATAGANAINARLAVGTGARGGLDLNVRGDNAKECPAGKVPCWVVAHVPLRNLIPWYLVTSEFDGLLVFDQNNALIEQDRRLPEQSRGEEMQLQRGEEQLTLAQFLAPGSKVDSGEVSLLSRRKDWFIRVAGANYRPFVQRLSVSVSNPVDEASQTPIKLTVVGLIETQRFWRDAVALPPSTLVRAVSLLLLGLLAIPFLKLRFIGPHERMRTTDIWLLAGSVLVTSALLVLLVLHEYTTSLLKQRFDDALFGFSASVKEHVGAEVRAIQSQLARQSTVQLLLADAAQSVGSSSPPPARGSILTDLPFEYPLLEALFYSGKHDGLQLAKLMPRTIPTPMVRIGPLPYFPNGLALQDRPFTFSPDVAITSGLRLGIFALPASLRNFTEHESEWDAVYGTGVPRSARDGIVALASPMPSLNETIVARPFQFVVLARGLVVFQSASGPYRGERFFERVAGGDALLYAAQFSSAESATIRSFDYRGHTYRMLAQRLEVLSAPDLPIDLVTYYEDRNVELLAAEAFSTGALLALAVIASVLLGSLLASAAFRSDALSWAWPSVSRNVLYAEGMLAAVLLALLMLLAARWLPSRLIPWMLVVVPGMALFTAGAVAWRLSNRLRPVQEPPHPSRLAHRYHESLFVGFGVVSILVLAAVPAAIGFDRGLAFFAARFEGASAEKLASDWLARSPLKDQPIVLEKDIGSKFEILRPPKAMPLCDERASGVPGPIEDLRCVTTDRIYAQPANYISFTKMEQRLRRYDSCVDLRAAGSCNCRVSGVLGSVARCQSKPVAGGNATVGMDPHSWTAPFGAGSGAVAGLMAGRNRAGLWAGLMLVVALLSALVCSVARHVLGLHLSDKFVLPGPGVLTPRPMSHWMLLRPTRRVLWWLLRGPGVRLMDLQNPTLTSKQVAADMPGDETLLVIDHLEHRIGDKEWREALLELLRQRGEHGVAIASEIDPLHYLTQRARERQEPTSAEGADEGTARQERETAEKEVAAWALALARFEKIRYEARQMRALAPVQDRHLQRLHARIRVECRWSERLQRIGVQLLRRPDLVEYQWEELVRFVLDAAEPYYRSLWDLCSREEKLVLIQLAQEGLVNPKKKDVLRRLARRRLVVIDPRFGIINESLARFVRAAEPAERVVEWETSAGALGWKQIATPLYLLAAVVLALLLVTEQTLITNLLAIATGAATALGSLRSLFAQVRSAVPSKPA